MTYSSLCLPENIHAGGMELIPNFYYRDDGLKLWKIIHRFTLQLIFLFFNLNAEICCCGKYINTVKLFVFLRFASGMVRYYYPADCDVQKDSELQEWISEIFSRGFLENTASGRD